jgi:dTDP-4-dehydrorhamnose 3,5-epimerase
MDTSRFLILGANGQLGKALQALYPDAIAAGRAELDMSDWGAVSGYDWSKVDVILNAAAFTNVDGAETPEGRESSWKANAQAPGYLAKIAAQHDITLVHLSSEYVFDGTKAPHTEEESFTPLGVYGQTKAAGDIAVGTTPKHYILRTSWVIGEGANFVRTMMSLAERNISPTVVADQVGRLTFTDALTGAIAHLLQTKPAYGIYNLSNDGAPASWADITRTIFAELGRDDLTVTNTTTEAYFASKPNISPRPLGSELDLSKIKATGFTPRAWQEALHDYIEAEAAKPKE